MKHEAVLSSIVIACMLFAVIQILSKPWLSALAVGDKRSARECAIRRAQPP
jgi:hypothetical protein